MAFQHPQFLWALILLVVPIIIHLFNFRRYKKIVFTNVSLLKNIEKESKKTRRLKSWLLLAARFLAIFFLIMAFARPFLKKHNHSIISQISTIFIDNSFSMKLENEKGSLLQSAINQAYDYANSFNEGARFYLITNEFSSSHNQSLSQSELKQELSKIKPSPENRTLSEIIRRNKIIRKNEGQSSGNVLMWSDFQEGFVNKKEIFDTTTQFYHFPLQAQSSNNVSIDSIWFKNPILNTSQTLNALVKITNYSQENITNLETKLEINNELVSLYNFELGAEQSKTFNLNFLPKSSGWNECKISIEDYPMTFDNDYYFSFYVPENSEILDLSLERNYFQKIYQLDSFFTYEAESINKTNLSSLKDKTLVIINGQNSLSSGMIDAFRKYVSEGGSLCLIPPIENIPDYNKLSQSLEAPTVEKLEQRKAAVTEIDYTSNFFKSVFKQLDKNIALPQLKKYYKLKIPLKTDILMRLDNSDAFFTETSLGKGKVYVFNSPLNSEWSDFNSHLMMIPIFLKMGFSESVSLPLSYVVHQQEIIPLKKDISVKQGELQIKEKDQSLIPEIITKNNRLYIGNFGLLKNAGNHGIYLKESNKAVQYLSMNYNRKESVPKYNWSDLENLKNHEISTNPEASYSALAKGGAQDNLWKIAIMLVLIFLVLEMIILKLMKQ